MEFIVGPSLKWKNRAQNIFKTGLNSNLYLNYHEFNCNPNRLNNSGNTCGSRWVGGFSISFIYLTKTYRIDDKKRNCVALFVIWLKNTCHPEI